MRQSASAKNAWKAATRGFAGLGVVAALAMASGVGAIPKEIPPQPGYACSVGRAFDDTTWGAATLDASGQIVSYDWTWRTKPYGTPFRLLVLGGSYGAKPVKVLGGGNAFLSWNLQPTTKSKPPKRRVQLTSNPSEGFSWGAIGTGELKQSFAPSLYIYWPDLLAFAKSATAMNFNLLDDKGRFLERQNLDPGLFLRAETEIVAMVDALNGKITHRDSECEKRADIIERDIVV